MRSVYCKGPNIVSEIIMSKAGKWEIDVASPYPCWCSISYGDQEIRTIHHTELRDLEYVVKRAIIEVRNKLSSEDKHEMD